MVGGILKNKNEVEAKLLPADESTKEFRSQVLKNTKLNAMLRSDSNTAAAQPSKSSDAPSGLSKEEEEERLKWNSQNLNQNAVIQKEILENMKTSIDEPKTPFQTAHELNEYYQDDEEEDDLNNFSLGAPEVKVDPKTDAFDVKIHDDPVEEERKNSKHSAFDELRKEHYHNEHVPTISNEGGFEEYEANNDENADESIEIPKPKKSFAELRKEHYKHEHIPKSNLQDLDMDEDDD